MGDDSPVSADSPTSAMSRDDVGHRRASWPVVGAAVVAWIALWWLTPGLHGSGVGSWFTDDGATQVLIESVVALVVLVPLALLFRDRMRDAFPRSRQLLAYLLPIGLAIALPFQYDLEYPVGIYLFWMTVSVVWQQTLTFGLLQSFIRDRLPAWATILVVAVLFWLGHVVWLPERFGLGNPVQGLLILAMGLLVAALRTWLKGLHIPLALHIAFYFAFA